MHELNICLSIIRIIEEQAERDHFHQVKTLWLEVGDLAGVGRDALQFSFPIAASQSVAANAALEIIPVSGLAWCQSCQVNVTMETCFSPCPLCGGYHYQIIRGNELKVLKMEVE